LTAASGFFESTSCGERERENQSVVIEYRALLIGYRALLIGYRALLI